MQNWLYFILHLFIYIQFFIPFSLIFWIPLSVRFKVFGCFTLEFFIVTEMQLCSCMSACQVFNHEQCLLRNKLFQNLMKLFIALTFIRLDFSLPVASMEMSVPDNAGGDRKQLTLTNYTDDILHWRLDVQHNKNFLEDSAFRYVSILNHRLVEQLSQYLMSSLESLSCVCQTRYIGSYIIKKCFRIGILLLFFNANMIIFFSFGSY